MGKHSRLHTFKCFQVSYLTFLTSFRWWSRNSGICGSLPARIRIGQAYCRTYQYLSTSIEFDENWGDDCEKNTDSRSKSSSFEIIFLLSELDFHNQARITSRSWLFGEPLCFLPRWKWKSKDSKRWKWQTANRFRPTSQAMEHKHYSKSMIISNISVSRNSSQDSRFAFARLAWCSWQLELAGWAFRALSFQFFFGFK